MPILATFKSLLMVTLTVDPKLFGSPDEADRYVCRRSCVAELVRSLHRAGWLHTRRYFVVREWQRETKMAHYHVLLDSSFVPFDVLRDRWALFRPATAGPVEGKAPAFGHVRISKPRFANAAHAARYACKYLVKVPEEGYPAWVMESRRRIVRYSTSKGFWAGCGPGAKCDVCDKVVVDEEGEADDPDECAVCEDCEKDLPGGAGSCVRERVAGCCQRAAIIARAEFMDSAGELFFQRYFVNVLPCTLTQAVLLLGGYPVDGMRSFGLERGELTALREALVDPASCAVAPDAVEIIRGGGRRGLPWQFPSRVGEGRAFVLAAGGRRDVS